MAIIPTFPEAARTTFQVLHFVAASGKVVLINLLDCESLTGEVGGMQAGDALYPVEMGVCGDDFC